MISLTLSIEAGPDTKLKHFDNAVTEALKQAVRSWHSSTAPLHFKPGAARKYGYQPRSKKYQNYKNRLGKGPLIFSGNAKRQLLRVIRPIGTKGHVKGKFVTSPSVRYFWMQKRGDPPKGKELIAVTKSEERALGKNVEEMTIKYLEAIKEKRVVK